MRYGTILPMIVIAVAFAHGCGSGGGDGGGPTPTPTPTVRPQALVMTTDFVTGSFATIDLDAPRSVMRASATRRVDGDAGPRVFGNRVYLLNRSFDEIEVLDPSDDFATLSTCSTGGGSNPRDLAVVSADKAYVTLYNDTDLLIIDPSVGADCAGFVRGRIDLSVFADDDGLPEMDAMAIIDGRLYVTFQHLDRNAFFAPAGLGQIGVIDIASDSVIGEITLGAENPFGSTKGLTVDGDDVIVSLTGAYGVLDGGIQRVDAVNQELKPFIITETDLGGDVTDFVIVSPTLGYAVIAFVDFTGAIVRFNPTTGRVTGTLLGSTFPPDIELNDRGELYVSDRTAGNAGIRIFRASDGTEITSEPLDVGLPAEIVFVP